MSESEGSFRLVEARVPAGMGMGTVELLRQSWAAPIDRRGISDEHHLELSLLPRSPQAEGGFPDDWGPHRFEAIGELFLIPAGKTLHARSGCQHQHSVVFRFRPQMAVPWFDCDLEWTDSRLRACLDISSTSLRALMFRIGEELRTPGPASAPLIKAMAIQVAVELYRHFLDIEETRATGGLAPWRLRRIEERLMKDLTPPSLAELAALCAMSERHLARAFRASRGRSIGSYILDVRMDHARQMLASGMSVKEAAHLMGFASMSSFGAAFRRATGETPSRFRHRASRQALGGGAA